MHLEGSDKRNAADGNKAFLRRGVAEAGRGVLRSLYISLRLLRFMFATGSKCIGVGK